MESFEASEGVAEGGYDGGEGDVPLRDVGAGIEVDVSDDVKTTRGCVGGEEEFHGSKVFLKG